MPQAEVMSNRLSAEPAVAALAAAVEHARLKAKPKPKTMFACLRGEDAVRIERASMLHGRFSQARD